MTTDILVTFMIATRNRVAELEKTLAACFAQDWPALEILVVDDASTDGTLERVRANFPRVNIVRRERNQGSIAARNDIVRRRRGNILLVWMTIAVSWMWIPAGVWWAEWKRNRTWESFPFKRLGRSFLSV